MEFNLSGLQRAPSPSATDGGLKSAPKELSSPFSPAAGRTRNHSTFIWPLAAAELVKMQKFRRAIGFIKTRALKVRQALNRN
jgi:hypothetical protein